MYLVKDGDAFYPLPESRVQARKLGDGEIIRASGDRNPKFHRKVFALIDVAYKNQDKYQSKEAFRKIMEMKAGYVDWVPGKDGQPVPLPKSMSYGNMGQEDFEECWQAMLKVMADFLEILPAELEEEIDEQNL